MEEQEASAPGNHVMGRWEAGEAASCGLPGTEHRACKACGQRETRQVAATAHRFSAWEVSRASSCHEAGKRGRSCKRCGLSQVEELPFAKHRFGPWENQPRSDCSEEGVRQRACTSCGHLNKEALKPRNHAYHRWETIRTATCVQAGLRERNCKHCDYRERQELPLRKHTAGKWQVLSKAALEKPGIQVKACKKCGAEMQRRSYYPGKHHFAVDFCVGGIPLREVWPEVAQGHLTALPIPLGRDGTYRLPLIAGGTHQVGEVRIAVEQGHLNVAYTLSSKKTEILKERLQVFIPGQAITSARLQSTRQGLKLNKPISIPKTLKNAEIALVFLRMDGIFYLGEPENLPLQDAPAQMFSAQDVFAMPYEALIPLIRELFEYE
jgi:ribosomal protein L32